ncbi:MAG TPA: DNA gyrase C-terminal beta-propeller domain-containing protein, partial [Bacillota bacterium]|nr:DNA gyrase C-terminal beta-propeller domain-containing protein [Bacillota bacterium]
SAFGLGKRVRIEEFRQQRRGGKGLIGMKLSKSTGPLTGFIVVKKENEEFITITAKGIVIRQQVQQVPLFSRYARGVTLIRLDQGDRVVDLIGII